MAVAALYALFAAAASVLNLGIQWVVVALWPWGLRNVAALVAGTGAGLVLKYTLDKWWIFRFKPPRLRDDAKKFLLYAGTGVITTGIFWGVELAFIAVFGAPWARYAGGAAGLCVGYSSKYMLDRKVVFSAAAERVDGDLESSLTDSIDRQAGPGT